MDENEFQEFTSKYGEEVVLNGYEDFEKFAAKRKKTFEDLKTQKVKEDIKYSQFNKDFGTNRKFDYDGHLKYETEQLSHKENEIAAKHGHKEKEQTAKKGFSEFKKLFEQQIKDKKVEKDQSQEEQFADFKKSFSKEDNKNEKLDDREKQQSTKNKQEQPKEKSDQSKSNKDFAAFKENIKSVTGRGIDD